MAECTKHASYNICVSQGSVATRLRYGGLFNNSFVANCLQSVTVKKLLKSVNIWRRYRQKFGGTFFSWTTVCIFTAGDCTSQSVCHANCILCRLRQSSAAAVLNCCFVSKGFVDQLPRPSRMVHFMSVNCSDKIAMFEHCVATVLGFVFPGDVKIESQTIST